MVILRVMRATSDRASSCTMAGCAARCFRTLRGQHARISAGLCVQACAGPDTCYSAWPAHMPHVETVQA